MARVDIAGVSIRARQSRRRRIVLGVLGALVGALLVGVVLLVHAQALRIQKVDVLGTKTVDSSAIEAQVRQTLSGSYFFIVPKDSIFFYSKSALERMLLATHPTLKEVSVRAESFSSISISAVDREPRALWCPGSAFSPSCMVLDEEGVAYAQAPSDVAFVTYRGGVAGQVPWQFLTPERFKALAALVDAVSASQKDNPVEQVAVDDNLDVHATLQNNFVIIFSLSDQGGDIFERFKLALTADPFKSHPLTDFEYLDLRFGDKLYYKLKGQ